MFSPVFRMCGCPAVCFLCVGHVGREDRLKKKMCKGADSVLAVCASAFFGPVWRVQRHTEMLLCHEKPVSRKPALKGIGIPEESPGPLSCFA